MSEKIETVRMDVPSIAGTEVVFIATICVGKDGKASIAYNALDGVNLAKAGQALAELGKDLVNIHRRMN